MKIHSGGNHLVKQLQIALSHGDMRVFRNNVGEGWVGKIRSWLPDGAAIIDYPQRINFGLAVGSSDLIGWKSIVITPDMVGKKIAVFTTIEAKTGTGRLNDDQKNWLEVTRDAGAIACVARSISDAEDHIAKHFRPK